MRLANGLESHDATRAALAEGRVHVEQAEAILRALTELPDDLDPDITVKAEQHLLAAGRRPRRQSPQAPGPPHPRGRLPRRRRRPRSQAPRTRGTRRPGRHPADDVRRRPRQGPRQVHPPRLRRAPRSRRPCTRSPPPDTGPAPRPARRTAPHPRTARAGVLRDTSRATPPSTSPRPAASTPPSSSLMSLDTLMGGLKAAHLDTGETDLPRTGPAARCRRRDHPRRPRQQVPGPRPGPQEPVRQRHPTHPQDPRGRRLRSRRLRRPTRHVPAPPPHPLGRRRRDQPRPDHDLPLAPHAEPTTPATK